MFVAQGDVPEQGHARKLIPKHDAPHSTVALQLPWYVLASVGIDAALQTVFEWALPQDLICPAAQFVCIASANSLEPVYI